MWIFIGRGYSKHATNYTGYEHSWWDDLYGDQITIDKQPVTEWQQYVDGVYFIMMTVTSVGYGNRSLLLLGLRAWQLSVRAQVISRL